MEAHQFPKLSGEKQSLKVEIPLEDAEQHSPTNPEKNSVAEQEQVVLTHRISSPRNPALAQSNSNNARSCLCSPTTHPGSFRCRMHRSLHKQWSFGSSTSKHEQPMPSPPKKDVSSPVTISSTVEAL